MAKVHEQWSPEVCRERHGTVTWVTGVLFSVLGLVFLIVGWSLTKSYTAASQVEVISTQLQDDRVNIKEDVADLKGWMRAMSAKQDKTNETLQVLVAQQKKESR